MKKRILASLLTTAVGFSALVSPVAAREAHRPNILVIVADDLGYSDIGAFGGEIRTPNLDALARRGVRFTSFHTAPICAPSRAELLTGADPHRVGVGTVPEIIATDQQGKRGYEGSLRPDTATLAEILGAGGYRTLMSGKWHLGVAPAQDPHARGFQHSFALLQAAHNHFGVGLSVDPTKGSTYTEDGKVVTALPADFYSSDYFTTKMVRFLDDANTGAGRDTPFFAYLAFTAPHSPLQAPRDDIARYRGAYDAGFEVLRQKRLRRQVALGLLDPATIAHPPERPAEGWNALSPAERHVAAREMEVYAAMVDRFDRNVGRVIDELKRTGRYDDTLIVFLADNGAEGIDGGTTELSLLRRTVVASDNTLNNIGNATSFATYGPGWAAAATAPSWRYKTYATEGGSRTPFFVSGPSALIGAERVARAYVNASDVAPTLLDIAGIADPKGHFAGREVEPISGKSLVPYLLGKAAVVHTPDEATGIEIFGSRSIRKGDWKITDLGDGAWHLFDVVADPGETKDRAASEPARLRDMLTAWDVYAKQAGVILPGKRPYTP